MAKSVNPLAVVFDLDGTLLYTLRDLADSMNSVLARFDFPIHEIDAYRYFVGDGMKNLVIRTLPESVRTQPETVERCVTAMREEYASRWKETTRPYDGVPELLDGLTTRGIRMAVLSNKPHDRTLDTVSTFLSGWKFEVVLGERPSVPIKPDPAGALEVAALMGVPVSQFIYVGDTATDMLTARRAGMYPAGALWGFRDADELLENGAATLLREPTELLEFFPPIRRSA